MNGLRRRIGPESGDDAREAHTREAFLRALEEFLQMSPEKTGSVTIHFSRGRRVRKVEWRAIDDADQWEIREAS